MVAMTSLTPPVPVVLVDRSRRGDERLTGDLASEHPLHVEVG